MVALARIPRSLKFEKQRVRDIEEQNQSKLRFFFNVSHEIRTPLTVIISLADSLIKEISCTGDTRNKLTGIYRNCNQLRSLISELLDFRKQEQDTHISTHAMPTCRLCCAIRRRSSPSIHWARTSPYRLMCPTNCLCGSTRSRCKRW